MLIVQKSLKTDCIAFQCRL